MSMTVITLLLILVLVPIGLLVGSYVVLVVGTLILAELTRWRCCKTRNSNASTLSRRRSSFLYTGRVSHSRYLPAKHSFSYPIFMLCVDLAEDFQGQLYPLSLVMSLRDKDHYKNNEGIICGGTGGSLAERTLQLVAEKTKNKFQPTPQSHSVKLLTHLSYYGYCFNPVSFYYVQCKTTKKIDAIVAEVSNTPWNEMQCYVLHQDSIDIQSVEPGRTKKTMEGINYTFRKTFHVSPFMDMEHMYDWTFWEFIKEDDPLCISTSMKKGEALYFNAYLEMYPKGLHPYTLTWQLVSYPVFCFLIQLWIHYEAFWLFIKGVNYVPHPDASETTASRIIGNMMIPFFAFKDWLDARRKQH